MTIAYIDLGTFSAMARAIALLAEGPDPDVAGARAVLAEALSRTVLVAAPGRGLPVIDMVAVLPALPARPTPEAREAAATARRDLTDRLAHGETVEFMITARIAGVVSSNMIREESHAS